MGQKSTIVQSYKEFVFKGVNIYYVAYVCKVDSAGPDICTVSFIKDRGLQTEKKLATWAEPAFVTDIQVNVLQPWLLNGSIPFPNKYNYLMSIPGVSTADFNSLNTFISSAKAQGCFN